MFGIVGTAELSIFCPGTGTWNRLQDGTSASAVTPPFFKETVSVCFSTTRAQNVPSYARFSSLWASDP